MKRGPGRFIPLILVILVVILIIAAAISIGRALTGAGDDSDTEQTEEQKNTLLETSPGHEVVMTARGKIIGNDNFRTYKITVSPDSRDFARYKGYDEQPLVTKSYDNNNDGYTQFVYALNKANMMKGEAFSGDKDDTRGVCAGGVLYDFAIKEDGQTIKHLWTSTCGGDAKGSLDANRDQLITLFQSQVPAALDYIGKD